PCLRSALSTASGPGHALIGFRDRAHALEQESLHPGACVGFGCVEVALRVGGQIVDAEELSRPWSAVADRRQDFEPAAMQKFDILVDAVGGVNVGLLRIA